MSVARALVALIVLSSSTPWASTAAAAPPRVELLTIEPGDPVWTRFGHTAVRVRSGLDTPGDLVFSFGYAPFDDPAFALDYLRGEADFEVGVRSWPAMLRMYDVQNRTFVRQPLRLSPAREAQLVAGLSAYLLPEHRHYRYAQLTDNCATRVRDLIDAATGGALRRAVEGQAAGTYRDHTLAAAGDDVLLSFALDAVGGPNQDRHIDGWEALYLPQKLREAVRVTRVDGRVLGGRERIVFSRRGAPVGGEGAPLGRLAWLATCVLVALWLTLQPPRRSPRARGALWVALGLWLGAWGAIVSTLVSVSQVPDFAWNENLGLFWPTDLTLCLHGARTLRRGHVPLPRWLSLYATLRVGVALAVAVLTATGAWPQQNLAFACSVALVFWPLTPLGTQAQRTLAARAV